MEMKYTLCNYVMFENIICISHLAPSLFESSTSDLSLSFASSVINCQYGIIVLDLSINIVKMIIFRNERISIFYPMAVLMLALLRPILVCI